MEDLNHDACEYHQEGLNIFIIGASGDLAKKKTYPSLFALYQHGYLSNHTIICGYARSQYNDENFRKEIGKYLKGDSIEKEEFLKMCIYHRGAYDSKEDFYKMSQMVANHEQQLGNFTVSNRLFYFAIPPSVFVPVGTCIKQAALSQKGWNRLIIEKPFGRDTQSFAKLTHEMKSMFSEDHIYRIDHYLGKEMVQNLMILRFGNTMFEPLWNRNYISSVSITFKEDIGTQGRGGYFDSYGILRDVMQNHLLQVLSIIAMEPPVRVSGDNYSKYVRDEKVKVLECIQPIQLENTVLGQYLSDDKGKEPGYLEDPTVPDDSVTPTFATTVLYINNSRWDGVPFIMKAGKALNERKGEIRIQFKHPPGSESMFPGCTIPRNELVMRLQPDEAVYMKTNVKSPGLATVPVASELDLSYKSRFADTILPDAYTRLILDVLRGKQATFVRDDELQAAWEIFTPLLHRIEKEKIKPIPYAFNSRGPKESDELIARVGYEYHKGNYQWLKSSSL